MLVQLKLAGPSPPPPIGRAERVAEEGMAQLTSAAPTFACKTVAVCNHIFCILAFYERQTLPVFAASNLYFIFSGVSVER